MSEQDFDDTGMPPTMEQLASYPWIVAPANSPLREQWEKLFGEGPPSVTPPATPIECGSVMVIRGLLVQSDLLTLLSPDQVALEVGAGMLERIGPRLPAAVRTIGISTRANWRPTASQARFIDLLHRASKETRLHKNG